MTVLRVLLAAAPASDRADAWALFDAAGSSVRTGRDPAPAWPKADEVEFVLAASQVHVASVTLPPLPASRVAGAAGFALEDQLAGPSDAHHIAVSAQERDGRVRVAVAARSLLASIAGSHVGVARIVAEPDLAPSTAGWTWCAREANAAGFIRRQDGSAFPVDAPSPDGALPTELALALAQARRSGSSPSHVRIDAPFAEASLVRWQRECGVDLVPGTAWRWEAAPAGAFADAINLLPRPARSATAAAGAKPARLFAPALFLAGAALALHVVATVGEWASLRFEAWRAAREWTAIAAAAGVAPDAATTPVAARAALARRYAEIRHAQGLPAPDDALPLLARGTPALATLPAGAVKSASYADGHWTLDLTGTDAAAIGNLDARMRAAGVPALVATSAAGTRVRFGGP
jgi:type II secretion system protein L